MNKYRLMFLLSYIIVVSGCASFPQGELWPMILHHGPTKDGDERYDALWQIFSYQDTPSETSYSVRPFFHQRSLKDKDFNEMLILWPFGLYRTTQDLTQIQILPVYFFRDKKDPEKGVRDFDWFFLPFLAFGGTDTIEGDYLYLFCYGNMKGLLGYDEIEAKPLPFYVRAKDGDYETRGYMWPLFRFGEGGGKKFKFYCFMYAYYEEEGKFRRESYLWPFVHIQENDLNKKHPTKLVTVFPFYGVSQSDVATSKAYLWPFFTYAINEETGYEEYNLPFPIFKWKKGGKQLDTDELRFFPLYWHLHQPDTRETRILWPLVWDTWLDRPAYTKESFYALPLYWDNKSKDKKTGIETRSTKVWPLYHYKKEEDGTIKHTVLSPLWFEDYIPYGFDKMFSPFFTLFEHCEGPGAKKAVTLLGPLYQYDKDKDSLYHRVLFCTYNEKEQEKQSRFSVLWGLFEYQNDKGEKSLRFFYLPNWLKWGEKK